jgi:hypothetical protein
MHAVQPQHTPKPARIDRPDAHPASARRNLQGSEATRCQRILQSLDNSLKSCCISTQGWAGAQPAVRTCDASCRHPRAPQHAMQQLSSSCNTQAKAHADARTYVSCRSLQAAAASKGTSWTISAGQLPRGADCRPAAPRCYLPAICAWRLPAGQLRLESLDLARLVLHNLRRQR